MYVIHFSNIWLQYLMHYQWIVNAYIFLFQVLHKHFKVPVTDFQK